MPISSVKMADLTNRFWVDIFDWTYNFKYPLWHWTSCRYKHFWANDHKLITYDRLITDHTNGEYLGNFDVEAGTFTAGTPGSRSQYLWTNSILVKIRTIFCWLQQLSCVQHSQWLCRGTLRKHWRLPLQTLLPPRFISGWMGLRFLRAGFGRDQGSTLLDGSLMAAPAEWWTFVSFNLDFLPLLTPLTVELKRFW